MDFTFSTNPAGSVWFELAVERPDTASHHLVVVSGTIHRDPDGAVSIHALHYQAGKSAPRRIMAADRAWAPVILQIKEHIEPAYAQYMATAYESDHRDCQRTALLDAYSWHMNRVERLQTELEGAQKRLIQTAADLAEFDEPASGRDDAS